MIDENYYIKKNASLDDAIIKMNLNKIGFLAIVDNEFKLVGILTDSDLRTAFLEKKIDLLEIINKNPKKMTDNIPKEKVLSELKQSYLRHMPIVNNKNVLVNVIVLANEQRKFKSNTVVIMAGGLGTRLGDLTTHTPKPMLNIGEKPILEHIIKNCLSYGFCNFMISVNYKQEVIMNYFGDGSFLGANIQYIEENKRLGTGGALSLIKAIEENFIVINGDVVTSVNFDELFNFHIENDCIASVCVKKSSFSLPYGVVNKTNENDFLFIEEKPSLDFYINAGIYVLSRTALKFLNKNEYCDMPWLIKKLKDKKSMVKVFEFTEFWSDIGDHDNYNDINKKFSKLPNL